MLCPWFDKNKNECCLNNEIKCDLDFEASKYCFYVNEEHEITNYGLNAFYRSFLKLEDIKNRCEDCKFCENNTVCKITDSYIFCGECVYLDDKGNLNNRGKKKLLERRL